MRLYKKAYIIISGFILLIGLILTPFINVLVPNTPDITENIKLIFFLYILNASLSYLLIYRSVLLTASQKNYYISYVNIFVYILKTIVQVIIIVVFKMFILYLLTEKLFSLINNIIVSKIAHRHFPRLKEFPKDELSREEVRSIFKNIKALSLYKISGAVLLGSNGIILSFFYGVGVVGYISNYTLIIQQLYAFALQFFNSITSSIGNLVASDDCDRQINIFERAFFFTSLFFCVTSIVLLNSLRIFIGDLWLGDKYIIPNIIVIFLCLDFYLKGIASIVNSFRNANGLFTQGQYRPVIMVILNILFAIIGIKIIGIPGVYIGTVISRLLTQTWFDPYILYRYAFKDNSRRFFKDLFLWFLAVCTSGYISMLICSHIFPDNHWLHFILISLFQL